MSRKARILSSTGIYHIMFRGINHRIIFYDDEDYRKYLDCLSRYKAISAYKLYAYCLMDNHIHLLLKTEAEPLEIIFRRICDSYIPWYNQKYDRCGYLFQGRFKSEAVENDRYFLTVLRYILQNPLGAGLCKSPEEYIYSSAREYYENRPLLSDIAPVLNILSHDRLIDFLSLENNDHCLEDTSNIRMGDKAAYEIVKKALDDIEHIDKKTLQIYIPYFLDKGISLRQISRITGISRSTVTRLK